MKLRIVLTLVVLLLGLTLVSASAAAPDVPPTTTIDAMGGWCHPTLANGGINIVPVGTGPFTLLVDPPITWPPGAPFTTTPSNTPCGFGPCKLDVLTGPMTRAIITVTVKDLGTGLDSAPRHVYIAAGHNGVNTIPGHFGPDMLFGLDGRDMLLGKRGNDLLCGGNGDDSLNCGPGLDRGEGNFGWDHNVRNNCEMWVP